MRLKKPFLSWKSPSLLVFLYRIRQDIITQLSAHVFVLASLQKDYYLDNFAQTLI